jgi:hypothetical protein
MGQLVNRSFHSVQKGGVIHPIYGGKGEGGRGKGERRGKREVLFLDGTVSEETIIPVHQRTFVYSSSAVFHRRIDSSRSRLVDLLRLQRRQVGRSSCGRVSR